MLKQLQAWLRVYVIAAIRLYEGKYTYQASALAFTTILGLVPLLSAAVAISTIFPFFTQFITLTRSYILANFIPASSSVIESYLETFTVQASRLPKLSIIFLFITAITLIITVKNTLNDIWHRTKEKKKIITWGLYWLVLLLTPFFISLTLLLSSYLFSLPWLATITHQLHLEKSLLTVLFLVITTVIFSTLYVVLSNYHATWRDGIFGGFITALLLELARTGFAIYAQLFPSYALIYGTLAIVPLFLVWLYISWLIILYGAMVTYIHHLQTKNKVLLPQDLHGNSP